MKRSNPLRLERLEDRTTPSTLTVSFVGDGTQVGALTSELYADNAGTAPSVWQQNLANQLQASLANSQPGLTLSVVPDDGASMNAPAPQDGAIRIAAVDHLFATDGTVATPPTGQDFLVAGGNTATFGIGLGLIGANGQPLSPTPPAPNMPGVPVPGQQSGLLPLILPVSKAYGNLYPTPTPTPAPLPTPINATVPPAPPSSPAPSTPSSPAPTSPTPDATTPTVPPSTPSTPDATAPSDPTSMTAPMMP